MWPDESAEAAYLADARAQGESGEGVPAEGPKAREQNEAKPLPTLDELVARVPADARELLDDLFRARFTSVRRVRPEELKS